MDYSDEDRDSYDDEESEDAGPRGRRPNKQRTRKDAGQLQSMKMPDLSTT